MCGEISLLQTQVVDVHFAKCVYVPRNPRMASHIKGKPAVLGPVLKMRLVLALFACTIRTETIVVFRAQ